MTIQERERRFIVRHLPKARAGDGLTMSNVAAAYRILGRHSAAYRWWRKAADAGDGSDTLEVGYCLHHGVGVRRNASKAIRAYETAIQSGDISELEREEAMFLLAVLLLSKRRSSTVCVRIEKLLRRANIDDDYPQAANLLASLKIIPEKICTCRRGLRFGLARLHCAVHKPRIGRSHLHPGVNKSRISRSTRSTRSGEEIGMS
jgi:TPR repeat protein